ncbi:MAG: winged helix-turn-helix domain-containing protein, partial [Myxococcota bacterium]
MKRGDGDRGQVLVLGPQQVWLDELRVEHDARVQLLTPLEASLLRYLADHGGVVPSEELHREVWNHHPNVRSRAARYTINRLRKKIEPDPRRPRYLKTIRGGGYRLISTRIAPHPTPALQLPIERGSFHGRSVLIGALGEWLEAHPLVTLIGPGGVGKTRLTGRFARQADERFPGGVFFCALDQVRSEPELVYVVAQALSAPTGAAEAPLERLGRAIASRGRCLVILDNFEQLVEHGTAAVQQWLAQAPQARWIVTSRARLGLADEMLLPVKPLPRDPCVALFQARAAAAGAQLDGSDEERDAICVLVERLDRLPLAVELAAARARLLSPSQLLARMSERFSMLRAPSRSGRHAALRATLDWSWALLSDAERTAAAWLSVFEGGFSVVAAESVLRDVLDGEWP